MWREKHFLGFSRVAGAFVQETGKAGVDFIGTNRNI
jgi:hypothetical protein